MPLPLNPSMVSTTDTLPGYRIAGSRGVVEAAFVSPYSGFTANGRANCILDVIREALLDLLKRASDHGANAIVGLRYVMPSDYQRTLLVYGTAVVVERL